MEESGLNVRVVRGGKVGVAGTTAVDQPPDEVVTRVRSADTLTPVAR